MKRSDGAGIETRIVASLIAFTLLVTSLPYLLGYFSAPSGQSFIGTVYNIDDYCNYLSWLRQMADGHFFLRNLFTTDPQKGLEFNLFFWLMGRLMALTHISPQATLQIVRIVGGLALLWLISRFYRYCLPQNLPARLTAFGFACLSSGFGWMQWPLWMDKNRPGSPVDGWQPEAFIFLSIYASALMTVSTLLILGALYALLRGEETGQWRYPVIAGICGGILGNIHSYDVLHLATAWGLFLLVWTVMNRGRGVAKSWARACVALALTLPTTGYMVYLLKHEAVFAKRASVPTLSPALWHYILGYGLVFLLAVVGGWIVVRGRTSTPNQEVSRPLLFAVCWAVAGLAVIYLPFAFQRKMLMGEHMPLCLLAGLGVAWLVSRWPSRAQGWVLILIVLGSAPSNVLFLVRDINHLQEDRSETHLSPFLPAELSDLYTWLRTNTPANSAVVGPPALCTYLPGEADRAVWAGHWGETPQYPEKEREFAKAFDAQTPDADRQRFLLDTHADYLFYPNDISQTTVKLRDGQHHFVELSHAPPAYLKVVYRNAGFTVYQIGDGR